MAESTPNETPKATTGFVHLHLHTSYSLLDAVILPKKLAKQAKALDMWAVACTDHGNMHAAIDFYKSMKAAGIKPILGVEIYVAENDRKNHSEKRNYHLVLLAENHEGYDNLCYLVSMANLEGFYRKPRIDRQLLREHSAGLIGLSACLSGEIPAAIADGRLEDAKRLIQDYAEIFGPDHFYLEVQKNGIPRQEKVNAELIRLARQFKLPLVATNDVHYLKPADCDLHDTLLCIGHGKLKDDPTRMRYDTDCLYLRSDAEMRELFADLPEAIENTVKIAERCNVELELGKPKLPRFPVPDGLTETAYFEKLAREGLEVRLAKLPYAVDRAVYEKRLDYEMSVIKRMDFPGYFLIVADFINYAKQSGIPVGPGRGSGAGSLVAYSLRITDLDPLRYSLLFERFLNPDRISMPDFDVDFCKDRREQVIQYVTRKYGENNVGQIATFGCLKARGVVRDVCRAFDIPLEQADRIAKLVPEGPTATLATAMEEEPRLAELLGTSAHYKRMYETARELEGLQRHTGVHAAGVVIAEKPLWEITPIMKNENTLVTQYAKDEVEAVGLVKFDFLGLKTLTVIEEAVRLINRQRAGGEPLVMADLTLDDAEVFKLISTGETNGIFQMESGGFQNMLRKLKPDRFEDIILAVAIYRPGPMDQIPSCVARKHGREKIEYVHPLMEKILNETYGLIVYQEQVMQIAADMGGFTMGEADALRKAMGKKNQELMDKMLGKFRTGARSRGIDDAVIERVAGDMVEFAKYGFNKSHAAAYAVITYQTAWLKRFYPLEFLAATLTCEMEHPDKVIKFIQETKRMGYEITLPSVTHSKLEFDVEEGRIRFGLGAVKGLGRGAIECILEARAAANDGFSSLYDLCEKVDLTKVNKRSVEALIKGGAFDELFSGRAKLLAALDKAVENGQARRKERDSGQTNLLDLFGSGKKGKDGTKKPAFSEDYPDVPEWTEDMRLKGEAESLGVYLSAHPMDRYAKEAARYCKVAINQVGEMENREVVTLAGIISDLNDRPMRGGKGRMARFILQDRLGSVECVAFSRDYEACAPFLGLDEPVLVTGAVMIDQGEEESQAKVRIKEIKPLIEAMKNNARHLHLKLPDEIEKEALARLREIIKAAPGRCFITCHVKKTGRYETLVSLPQSLYTAEPSAELFDRLESILGKGSAYLT